MKSLKTLAFTSGILVVVAVFVGISNDMIGRKQISSMEDIHAAGLLTSQDLSKNKSEDVLTNSVLLHGDNRQFYFLALAALLGLKSEKNSQAATTPTSTNGFAVVELFTSEGCDSCPPADELAKAIHQDDRTGKVYVLAFHVDYWDHQGWKDRFSEKEYTNRQIQYSEWLDLQTIYTPQIVVNGRREHVGHNKNSILKSLAAGLEQNVAQNLMINAQMTDGMIQVDCDGVVGRRSSELVLALIQKEARVEVKAGENMGKTLNHAQIVRRMSRVSVGAHSKKSVTIKPPVDFTGRGWEVIGFVQSMSNGVITSAARFDFETQLPSSK